MTLDAAKAAAAIVEAIEDDLTSRNGLGDEWDQIDRPIRDEIRKAWHAKVVEILAVTHG